MTIVYRPATLGDVEGLLRVHAASEADANRGRDDSPENEWADPEFVYRVFSNVVGLERHLLKTADHFWLAERDGQILGYASSLFRDGVRSGSEAFVIPSDQSAGVGRELIARVFPTEGARRRYGLGSTDLRAYILYLKSGLYPRFPCNYFSRTPEPVRIETDLTIQRVTAMPQTLAEMRKIDKFVLDHTRDVDHEFLLAERRCYLYRRGAEVVGYGYMGGPGGKFMGPFALVEESDFPAVLAHAETEVHEHGEAFSLLVPMINSAAVDWLLKRKCKLKEVAEVFFMSDEPFGRFEQYVMTHPPAFV